MPALSSWKKQKVRFLLSAGIAALAFFALAFLLSGPRLLPHYDFLVNYGRGVQAAREITLIETGLASGSRGAYAENILEPGVASRVILTLGEFGAKSLVIHSPVLGGAPPGMLTGGEIQERFDEEFALLSQNIENLFRGIQTGSIPPVETERYVENLIGLSVRGKERLLAALLRNETAGTRLLDQAQAAFGQVFRAEAVRMPGSGSPLAVPAGGAETEGGGEGPSAGYGYSHAAPDDDGVFRRIAPVLYAGVQAEASGGLRTAEALAAGTEHIAFAALRPRFRAVNFIYGASRAKAYPSRLVLAGDGEERTAPLDSRGRILVRQAREVPEVRRLPLQIFLDYGESEDDLARLLQNAENRGWLVHLDPEEWPDILYHYTRGLREEMLENPSEEKKYRWLDFRSRWLRGIDALLSGPSEMLLVNGYETRIASERLDRAGTERLIAMRDEVIEGFRQMRERYEEYSGLRKILSASLDGAFCVMGTVRQDQRGNPTDAEVSVILANSLLAGNAITPVPFSHIWPWSLGIAFLLLFLLRNSGTGFTLCAGIIAVLLEGAVFAFGFVFSGYWIDPLLPAMCTAAGVSVSTICAFTAKKRLARYFHAVYGGITTPRFLRLLVREEQPLPGESRQVRAAIIAVRAPELRSKEMRDSPETSAEALYLFREAVLRHFSRTGGVFLGAEGDMVLIAYGSPLERIYLNNVKSEIPYEDEERALSNNSPASKAVGAVMDLIKTQTEEMRGWVFGIDTGGCDFRVFSPGNYSATGPAVVRARAFAALTGRYGARILAGAAITEKADGLLTRKAGALRDSSGAVQEIFYQIIDRA